MFQGGRYFSLTFRPPAMGRMRLFPCSTVERNEPHHFLGKFRRWGSLRSSLPTFPQQKRNSFTLDMRHGMPERGNEDIAVLLPLTLGGLRMVPANLTMEI